MRRFVARNMLPAVGVRFYTAPAEAIKVYQSNFTSGPFPVEFVSSDVVVYAQFLYKLAESTKNYDTFIKDFDTLQNLKLPVFWERSTDVTGFQDVTKAVSSNFVFLLRWMQVQGSLEKVDTVRQYYETLLNAQKKKLVVTVYANSQGVNDSKVQSDAKALVTETVKTNALLKDKTGANLDFKFVVDNTVPGKGFYAEFGGVTLTTIPQVRSDELEAATGEVDFTNVTAMKQIIKTVWDDNVETDILRKYLDQLALYDEEEQKLGV
jgi:F0F1-type ATP synthase delta subunit